MKIEKFEQKEVLITNDVALYYITLGSESVVNELLGKTQTDMYTIDFSEMGYLSENDKQEIWEVLLLMVMQYENKRIGMRRAVAGVRYNFLTHYKLTREWDILLRVYNNEVMYDRMQELLCGSDYVMWQDFKDYYEEYKKFLGRECYVVNPHGSIVSEYGMTLQNYEYTVGRHLDEDTLHVHTLDDEIAYFEKRYPVVCKGTISIFDLGFRASRELSRMADRYKHFCDEFFKREVFKK